MILTRDDSSNSSAPDNIYFYNPSFAAAILFSVLYQGATNWHLWLTVFRCRKATEKYRSTIFLLVAAAISTAGFGTRIGSVKNVSSVGLYATSASLIVISPIFVCATLYLLLARMVRRCLDDEGKNQYLLGISPRWLARIFVTSDIISFLTQCSGSGIASSANWEGNTKDIGVDVLLFGLSMQLATFTFYLYLMGLFTLRTRAQQDGFGRGEQNVMIGMWIASIFVETRSIYRVVEFGLGIFGYPFQHEWMLYVFEAVPMLFALLVLAWYHPVVCLQNNGGCVTSHQLTATSKA